jgi:AcrR family transcriptional regulator
MPERPKKPSKAKARILDAAASLFHQKGFAAATVRDLADAVGILSGSLFHHFPNKGEILFAVMENVIIEMDAALEKALAAATDTKASLRALIRNELEFIHGPHGAATAVLVYEWNTLSPENQSRLLQRRRAYFARWHTVLARAKAEGLVSQDPALLRQLLHGAIVWSVNWYDPAGALSLTELEASVLALACPSQS